MVAEPSPESYSLDRFLAEVKNVGIARNNRFAVFFTVPFKLIPQGNLLVLPDLPIAGGQADTVARVLLLCEAVSVPGHTFISVPIRTFGEIREAPHELLYQAVPMIFFMDADMKVKYLFDEWRKIIMNPETKRFGYYNDYITQLHIMLFNIDEQETYRMICQEAFPKEVQAIHADHNNKDTMRMQVLMQIRNWSSTPSRDTNDITQFMPSPGLLDYFSNSFDDLQTAFNNFTQGVSDNDLFPHVQGFIAGANRFISNPAGASLTESIKTARSSFGSFT